MTQAHTIFTIPTYRLRDVRETVEAYDDNFWRNGHSVKMRVFDDSSLAGHYMRNPLAMEVFNEELCSLLKTKIKDSVYQRDDLGIKFRYHGEVTLEDTQRILEKVTGVHARVLKSAENTKDAERRQALLHLAENLAKVFYGFEPDFFQQNGSRIVDDVISQIQASLELWPTLVEICYYEKDKRLFPQTRVKNRRIKTGE